MKSLKYLASVSLVTGRLFIVAVFLLAISPLSAFATEAEDEQLLGLWKSDDSCFVHIYQTDDNQLVGAAWGQRKESAELLLSVGDDRRFPWKRKSKKSGFGDDFELDPKNKGRFIVDSNDRSILHSNVSPCFIRKGVPSRWKRVGVSSIAVAKVPKWYQANFQSSQALAETGQPEVEDTESAPSIEAKAKVKAKNQAQANSEAEAVSASGKNASDADKAEVKVPAEKESKEAKTLSTAIQSSTSASSGSGIFGGVLNKLNELAESSIVLTLPSVLDSQQSTSSKSGTATQSGGSSQAAISAQEQSSTSALVAGQSAPPTPRVEISDQCSTDEKICPPDPTKTLFLDLPKNLGIRVGEGEGRLVKSSSEAIELAGGRDPLKFLLTGGCLRCDLSDSDFRNVDFSKVSHYLRLCPDLKSESVIDNQAAKNCLEWSNHLLVHFAGMNLSRAEFRGSVCRTQETFPPNLVSGVHDKGCVFGPDGSVPGSKDFFERWNTTLDDADFSNVDFRGANFSYINGKNVNFADSDLRDTGFKKFVTLEMADFSNVDMRCSFFGEALGLGSVGGCGRRPEEALSKRAEARSKDNRDIFASKKCGWKQKNEPFPHVTLDRARFSKTRFAGTRLGCTSLAGASFEDTQFDNVWMDSVDLSDATFKNVSFKSTWIEAVNLSGAVFDNVILDETSVFFGVDLSGANLEKAIIEKFSFKYSKLCGTMMPWGSDDSGC